METIAADEVRPRIVSAALKRRWPAMLIIALLVTAVAVVGVSGRSARYSASASVLLRPALGNALSTDASTTQQATIAMGTEASLVQSPQVAQIASKTLGTTIQPASTNVTATVPPNTEVVQIGYTASSATASRDGAQAIANALLAFRGSRASSARAAQLSNLAKQVSTAQAGLKQAAAAAAAATRAGLPTQTQQVQLYTTQLSTLQTEVTQAQAESIDPGTVVRPAQKPSSPSGLPNVLLIVAGAIVGLGLGFAFALWRERRDDRIRAASTSSVADLPILVNLPSQRHPGPMSIAERESDDAMVGAYRQLRAAVIATSSPPAVLAVSHVSASAPVGDVALNLGHTLRSAGYAVAVVMANAHSDPSAASLGVRGPGLAEAVRGRKVASAYLVEIDGLEVLPPGRDSAEDRDLYAGDQFRTVISALRGSYEFVIIAAPGASTAEGSAIALAADRTLLVVANKRSTAREIDEVHRRAQSLGIDILGVIAGPSSSKRGNTPAEPAIEASPEPAPNQALSRDAIGTPGSS